MIHEAMEQQTVHVAKAGLVSTLHTRTAVIGVTNPKGPFKPHEPLANQINVSGPLLSRYGRAHVKVLSEDVRCVCSLLQI